MTTPPLLDAENLFWQTPDKTFTLQVPRFTLNPGDRYAVIGPSGCGKSTLLGLLSLALRPDRADRLHLRNHDTTPLLTAGNRSALSALRARHIGFVPQMSALLPFLSVEDNIRLPLDILNIRNDQITQDLLTTLGLSHQKQQMPATLSVGQRQRVAIARALCHQPDIVLADEPTAALHPDQATHVMTLLHQQTQRKAAVVMVTHDADRAIQTGFTPLPALLNGPITQITTP